MGWSKIEMTLEISGPTVGDALDQTLKECSLRGIDDPYAIELEPKMTVTSFGVGEEVLTWQAKIEHYIPHGREGKDAIELIQDADEGHPTPKQPEVTWPPPRRAGRSRDTD